MRGDGTIVPSQPIPSPSVQYMDELKCTDVECFEVKPCYG
jgi:hypothetical protein